MPLFIDSHVHVYPSYRADRMLAAFRKAVRRHGAETGVMMLVEREGTDVFADWAEGRGLPAGVAVARREEAAILLRTPGEPDVAVVSGRQIACSERVEILALGTRATFRDGMAADDAVAAARDAEALPVLAWGVGKWLFSRAKVVDSLLRHWPAEELAVGEVRLIPFGADALPEGLTFSRFKA